MLEHISKKEYQKYLKVVDGFHRFVCFDYFHEQLLFVCFDKYVHDSLRSRANIPATSKQFSVDRSSSSVKHKREFGPIRRDGIFYGLCPFQSLSVTDRILRISIGGRQT